MPARPAVQVRPLALLTAVSAGALVALAAVVALRLTYPYDLEWMEGAMLHHAFRIQEGRPLYAPPSLEFASFAYMPLQPALVALAGSLSGGVGYAAGRAVSVAGLLVALGSGHAFLRAAGAARAYALGGVALTAAAFAPTGAFHDLVRVDGLFLGLVAAAFLLAWRGRVSAPAAAAAGLVAALAFFAKQTAAPLLAFTALGLALLDRRRAALMAGTAALACLPVLAWLHAWSEGWFWTYAFGLHQRHGFDAQAAFVATPLRLLLLLAPAAALVPRALLAGDPPLRFLAVTAAGAGIASALGAGTEWAYANALIPGVFFGGLLVALSAARRGGRAGPLLLTLTIVAAPGGLVWVADRAWPAGGLGLPTGYDLAALVPSAADRKAGDALVARLRAVRGPVFVPFHTFYPVRAGHRPTLHAMNLADLNRAGLGTPRDLVAAIRARTFEVVVLDVEEGPRTPEDAEGEAIGQFPRLGGNYVVVERIDGPRVVSGAPVRPRLVLVPRPR